MPPIDPRPPNMPGLALTLASSHLGFHVHAGFLEVLTSRGIRPSHISGTSSGSFVGGLYARGMTPTAIRDLLLTSKMRRAFWEWRAPLRGLAMLGNLAGFTGLLTGRKLLRFLKSHIGDSRIEDCPLAELTIAVTNLTKARSQIIRKGPLAEYIVASCAVPGVFRGIEIDGERFWDGAVSDSSPFHHFLTDKRISTIIVHVISPDPAIPRPPTISWAFGQAHQIVTDRLLMLGEECAALYNKRVLVLTSRVPNRRFNQRGTEDELYQIGRATGLQHLPIVQESV